VPAHLVADQLGAGSERGSALAGAERSDEKAGVALVEIRGGSFLITIPLSLRLCRSE